MNSSSKITLLIRNYSKSSYLFSINKNAIGGARLVEKTALTDDGKMFVAWHPNQEFPYEYSKAIPAQEKTDSGSIVKETALNNAMAAFKNKHPEVARQELMKLTHTTKHRWFPRSRDKRAKKTPMDREYL